MSDVIDAVAAESTVVKKGMAKQQGTPKGGTGDMTREQAAADVTVDQTASAGEIASLFKSMEERQTASAGEIASLLKSMEERLNTSIMSFKEQFDWNQDVRDVISGIGIAPPDPKGEPRVSSLSPLLVQPRLNKIQENLDCMVKERQDYSKETAHSLFKGTNPDDHIQYIKRRLKVLRRICKTPIKERNKLEGYIERNLLKLEGKVSRLRQRLSQLYKVTNDLKQVEEQRRAVLESEAATVIFCWWRRRQLRCYFEKQRAARIINNEERLHTIEKTLVRIEEVIEHFNLRFEASNRAEGFGASTMNEMYKGLCSFSGSSPGDRFDDISDSLDALQRSLTLEKDIGSDILRLEEEASSLMQGMHTMYKLLDVECRIQSYVALRIQRWYYHCKASRAATTIQAWRRGVVTRRRQLKLVTAASSSPLRDRGQPLPPINHRQRCRRKKRAQRQRNAKRHRQPRKRGQQRGRPPNPTQPQQSQQQSIKRRENTLGIALSNNGRSSIRGSVIGSVHNNSSGLNTAGPYVLGRDFRRRDSNGRVTVLGTALQSSGLSSRENVIGKTLQGNESSSRGNTAETPQQDGSASHRSFTSQPISYLTSHSRRRRRRRRRRRKQPRTIHRQKDGASTPQRHTPTYPSSNAQLSNISDFCDGIRRQLHQASSSDRNLLKLMCQLVLQTVDDQPIEPSAIAKIESISTPTTVDSNPSSPTNNESFSSINIVDSHTLKSTTTKLTELSCSAYINTEENTTRREKPSTYLQALIGTTG